MKTVRAKHFDSYFRRFLWVGLILIAYGCWCLYDGFVAYPKKLEKSVYYHGLSDQGLDTEEANKKWAEHCEEKGWSKSLPEKPKKIRDGIQWQYIQLAICVLGAVFLLGKYFLAKGHWVESDGTFLNSSFGKPINLAQVEKLDKTKWANKGIAKLYHPGGVFVLDDFKFERKPMGYIMRYIESHLTDDQIVGGEREKDPQAEETT